MEEILEIRDGCKTPIQLLKSKAFSRYLIIYKKQFIKELKSREDTETKISNLESEIEELKVMFRDHVRSHD